MTTLWLPPRCPRCYGLMGTENATGEGESLEITLLRCWICGYRVDDTIAENCRHPRLLRDGRRL
mgnify:CR=1 FL=1